MRRLFALLYICLCLGSPALGQQQGGDKRVIGPPAPDAPDVISRDDKGHATIRTMRLPSPLVFDGVLDEAFYSAVKPIGDFIQIEPIEGAAATEKTEVWVFFDDKNVYVSARMHESAPDKRVTSDMRRDSNNLYNNDHFGVMFDTFDDKRNGYNFYANQQGGQFDAQMTNEQPNPNWNGLWDVRTANFDGGWTAEFRFPFRSMRFKPGATVWGINFRRMVRWKNEVSFLVAMPQSYGRRAFAMASSAGTMVGLESPVSLRNLDIKPYALGSSTTNNRSTPPVANDVNAEFGVDAKWGITQSFITDFTYNTDFAQVEDDEAQVNLTRFSVQFPEKREFFLEGQGTFNFAGGGAGQGGGGVPTAIPQGGGGGAPNNTPVLFFSRRIGLQNNVVVPIVGGGRLLGRAGNYQIGALQMHTGDSVDASADPTDFSVLRVNRDVLKRSRIGMIATRRSPGARGDYVNTAYGADAQFNFFRDLSINSYWSKTDTPGKSDHDESYRGNVAWNADKTGFQVDHTYVGENFNPEIGFLRRSAFRRSYASARYSPRPKGVKGVRKVYYEGSYDYYEDAASDPESREAQGAFRLEFTNSDQVAFEYSAQFEKLDASFNLGNGVVIPPGAYDFNQGKWMYSLSPQRPLSGYLEAVYGAFYGGTLRAVTYRGRAEFGPRFLVEPVLSFNYYDTPYGDGDSNIISTRLTYGLSPRMFASALIQFQSANDSVSTNARFRWEYQPGSELFVVYSDGRNTIGGGFPPQLDNRSFVVKVTRLFRW